MMNNRDDIFLAQPLLDRLMNDDPDLPADKAPPLSEQLAQLREALRRDLELLLNSRCRFLPLPDTAPALDCSLATFGMPDISHEDAQSSSFRKSMAETVRSIIERFEPRLRSVRIDLSPPRSATDCLLRFQIGGELVVQEGIEPVVFQTSLEPLQRFVKVEAARA